MAFLSDIYLPTARGVPARAGTSRRRLNWRLLLALAVNLAVWTSLIQGARALF